MRQEAALNGNGWGAHAAAGLNDMDDTVTPAKTESIDHVEGLPARLLSTYARLWQLETWLRRMIYVELKAALGGAWSRDLPSVDSSFKADKRLIHMPTPEMNALSYAQLSALNNLIAKNRHVFDCYLPPSTIWEAKMEEIAQIRHRVAHFRTVHEDDHRRVAQLLRDIDPGFWHFCTSYNDADAILPASADPVIHEFLQYDPFPWTEVGEREWARVGVADPSLIIAVTVEVLRRPWAEVSETVGGSTGHLYDVHLIARGRRSFDYVHFLQNTKSLHSDLVHLCLDSGCGSVRFTIPALLGSQRVIEVVERCLDVARYAVGPIPHVDRPVQPLADEWPEYVLGPNNPLTFLSPGMKCTFFAA